MLVAVAAGAVVAGQAPANNVISHRLGDLGAVTVDFAAGTVLVLFIAFALDGGVPVDRRVETPAWYYWVVGGLGGVADRAGHVGLRSRAWRRRRHRRRDRRSLGASVVLDRLGVLGLDERAITWQKLLGIALLAAGTVLIVRE